MKYTDQALCCALFTFAASVPSFAQAAPTDDDKKFLLPRFKADVLKGKSAVAAHKNMAYDLKKKL